MIEPLPSIPCPRDGEILSSNEVHGYRYWRCERCHGFWIPGAELHRVMSEKGIAEVWMARRGERSPLQCPECRDECEEVLVDGCRLDVCCGCRGLWLDAGEVQDLRKHFIEGSAVVVADKDVRASGMTEASFGIAEVIGEVVVMILPG
jgi:Zn-finger nucleic acid-binding protein